jgi:hypothetical protein
LKLIYSDKEALDGLGVAKVILKVPRNARNVRVRAKKSQKRDFQRELGAEQHFCTPLEAAGRPKKGAALSGFGDND